MSNPIDLTAARLQQDIPAAEGRVDDALIALSSLTATVVTARRDTSGVPVVRSQAAIKRLVRAQLALVDVGSDILRVHGEIVDIGREQAGYDLHEECPSQATAAIVPIGTQAA